MGKVEAAFSDSFIVKLEKENNMEIKYEIPRLEISSLTDHVHMITLDDEMK
jgi:hypothetical protein